MAKRKMFVGILLLFLLSCTTTRNTTSSSTENQTFLFDQDQLGQCYFLDSLGTLIKTLNGEVKGQYLRKEFGPPQHIDVLNPQKILLFYRQFNKLLILDQTLSSEREIDLEGTFGWQTSAVGQSSDRHLWLYNPIDRKIRKSDYQGKDLLESDPINFMVQGVFNPDKIIERDGKVIISDPQRGWLRLDLFGQFIDFLPQEHNWFQVRPGSEMRYWDEGVLWSWRPGEAPPEKITVAVNSEDLLDFCVQAK